MAELDRKPPKTSSNFSHILNDVADVSPEDKRHAGLVMSGTSLRVGASPVDLKTVLSALGLYEETSDQ